MTMVTKLQLLIDKTEKLLAVFDQVRRENTTLMSENAKLKAELAKLHREFNQIKLGFTDQSGAIRTKLTSVLGRLEELESLHQ